MLQATQATPSAPFDALPHVLLALATTLATTPVIDALGRGRDLWALGARPGG